MWENDDKFSAFLAQLKAKMFVNLESNFIEYSSSCRLSEKGLLRHLQYLKIGKQARCWMHFAPLSSSMLDEARFDHTNF